MSETFLNDQADLLETIADFLNKNEFRYFVTGSQASSLYGEPRFTQDIHIVLELSAEQLSQFLKGFDSEEFPSLPKIPGHIRTDTKNSNSIKFHGAQ